MKRTHSSRNSSFTFADVLGGTALVLLGTAAFFAWPYVMGYFLEH